MLEDYSNPKIVYKKAREIYGPGVQIEPSTRKSKKYMLLKPDGKWVHFGYYGMEDYTKHKDENRRDAFRSRNRKWAHQYKYSPAFASYWLLW
jgi:hypothetical protein